MKFGVVVFPGSNCDHDMIYVLRDKLGQEVVELWHKNSELQGVDAVVLPGGFSYGDYLRSGAIARYSPIMNSVVEFAKNGGHVFGICNGFQILCEADLLPGTLLHNLNQKFICRNTYIKAANHNNAFTRDVPDTAIRIPIAHGEGRYYADDETIAKIEQNDQVLFHYCDENGNISERANPNGSVKNIAGICNAERNVYGMMPHPERASDEELANKDGEYILQSFIDFVTGKIKN
ncbi:Phosphoribosylformylglycinamidine synthase 1 [Salinivirga cyanobacteriivorans]|uniref:Phosphoribosylformylglycinamidine synthase subunit PurQ n=1 Tax=Salinivirga cyanobacteriivorans TaxID=1307839 RepID=A0A0S2HZG1_9BACT|nr:phosphoribosylformylglycinamidine synthase subunit PurQ [Salinivirga cyanobacteriivorans]ALO15398.1 Phosphoribosylformylglycinamidine synthase 1 [Salinivirga cyanobacteriivorans]